MPCAAATALPSSTRPETSARRSRPLADAAVREPGERADRIRRRVEDHLAPLRAARVGDRARRHAAARARVGEPLDRRRTARGCGSYGPSVVSPFTSHCTCPGSSDLPGGERRAADHALDVPRRAPPRSRARSARSRRSRSRTRARSRAIAGSVCIAFVATMPKSHGGSSCGVGRRAQPAEHLAGAGEPQPVRVDRVDVLARRVVRPDLDVVELREIRREQRADRAAADDADPHE